MNQGYIVVMACLIGMAHSSPAGSGLFAHFRCEGNDLFYHDMPFQEMCPDFKFMIEPTESVSSNVEISIYAVPDPYGWGVCMSSAFNGSKPDSGLVFSHTLSASEVNAFSGPTNVADLGTPTNLVLDDSQCLAVCIAAYVEVDGQLTLMAPMQNGITDCNNIREERDVSVSATFAVSDTITLKMNDDGFYGFHLDELISDVTVSYDGMDSGSTLTASDILPHSVAVFMRPDSIEQRILASLSTDQTCGNEAFPNVTYYDDPLHFFNTHETLNEGANWIVSPGAEFIALGVSDPYQGVIPRCPVCDDVVIYVAWDIYGQYWLSDLNSCNNYVTKRVKIDCSAVEFLNDTIVMTPEPFDSQSGAKGKKCNGNDPRRFEYYPALGNAFTPVEQSWEDAEALCGSERVRFLSAMLVGDYFGGAFYNGSTDIGSCMAAQYDFDFDGTFHGSYWPSYSYVASNELWDYVDWGLLTSMDEPEYLQAPFRPVREDMIESCVRKVRQEGGLATASDDYLREGCNSMMYFVFQDKRCPIGNELYEWATDTVGLMMYFTHSRPDQAFINNQICQSTYNNTDIDILNCGYRYLSKLGFRHNVNLRRRVARDVQPLNDTNNWDNEDLLERAKDFFDDFMDITDELDYLRNCPNPSMWERSLDGVPVYPVGHGNELVIGTPDLSAGDKINCWTSSAAVGCMDEDQCYAMDRK